MTSIIIVSSANGSEVKYRYQSHEHRVAGLMGLMSTVIRTDSKMPCEFFFNEMDDDRQFDEEKNELAAEWNGEEWVVAKHGIPEPKVERVRLILDVEYQRNGETVDFMERLEREMNRAIDHSLSIGDYPAIVTEHSMVVLDMSDSAKMDAVGQVLQELYRDAVELKQLKQEINGDYSAEDLAAWDKRLKTAEMMVALMVTNRLDPALIDRAATLAQINSPQQRPTPQPEDVQECESCAATGFRVAH